MTKQTTSTTTTQTSAQWWAATKADPAKLHDWLTDQLRGETLAAARIEALRDTFHAAPDAARVLTVIAAQEAEHARWVQGLLEARGLPVVVDERQGRYWDAQALSAIADFETGCAVGAHAERMRLERIEVIAADDDAPADVRDVFARILPQERFHERAFRTLAGAAAMEATRTAHELGRAVLGLGA